MTRPESLQEYAANAIAERRHKKSSDFAFLAYAYGIPASDMQRAADHEWAQLTEAVNMNTGRKGTKREYGVPTPDTRLVIVTLMMEYERRKGVAA